ncbi:hypothetical protein VQ042_19185 [Aurantimonas sp. A2-1-M11]|uniref:hypothetical protein n=1 Tax=Aurantimonas sp. A2-1-M11 TaxID=3113712 RepID=UPI002F94B9F3
MPTTFYILDIAAIATALLAAWFWYQAGLRSVRRISQFERLDSADINRIVVAFNRNAVLNRRAALASAASAVCFALRFGAELVIAK